MVDKLDKVEGVAGEKVDDVGGVKVDSVAGEKVDSVAEDRANLTLDFDSVFWPRRHQNKCSLCAHLVHDKKSVGQFLLSQTSFG